MKKIVKILKNVGVLACTGMMAVVGIIIGTTLFKPENITIKNNKDENKESE